MYVLGIDTATLVCSVALGEKSRVVAEVAIHTHKTHSERLMPLIQQLIEDADLKAGDLGGIAVSSGPGSFTGLRIGITVAKSMAFALNIPLIGIPTLDALAAQIPYCQGLVCPVLDAQKGNVYTALFRTTGGYPVRVSDYQVLGMGELLDDLTAGREPVVVMGEITGFAERLQGMDAAFIEIAAPLVRMPRGAAVAMLGLRELQKGNRHDPRTLTPFYIRRSEAEVLWERRYGGGDSNGSTIPACRHR